MKSYDTFLSSLWNVIILGFMPSLFYLSSYPFFSLAAALKAQPYDLLRWSAAYFRCLSMDVLQPVKPRYEHENVFGCLTKGYLKVLLSQVRGWVWLGVETNPCHVLFYIFHVSIWFLLLFSERMKVWFKSLNWHEGFQKPHFKCQGFFKICIGSFAISIFFCFSRHETFLLHVIFLNEMLGMLLISACKKTFVTHFTKQHNKLILMTKLCV
jgi:hypothetical protein